MKRVPVPLPGESVQGFAARLGVNSEAAAIVYGASDCVGRVFEHRRQAGLTVWFYPDLGLRAVASPRRSDRVHVVLGRRAVREMVKRLENQPNGDQ